MISLYSTGDTLVEMNFPRRSLAGSIGRPILLVVSLILIRFLVGGFSPLPLNSDDNFRVFILTIPNSKILRCMLKAVRLHFGSGAPHADLGRPDSY